MGATLILPPSQNYSYGRPAACASYFHPEYYPATNATDDSNNPAFRCLHETDTIQIDLGQARTPNLFAVFNTNLDEGMLCGVQASSSPTMTPLLLDVVVEAHYPNFWIDLRGTPVSARYWRLVVNGNSRSISVGEIVIGTAFLFDGVLEPNYREAVQFWGERGTTEYGKLVLSASGAMTRKLSVTLSLTAAEQVNLEQVFEEASGTTVSRRVVMVPDAHRNDVWLLDWPLTRSTVYPVSDRIVSVTLDVLEQSGGVV